MEGFFTHKDVPGGNDIGAVLHDEACFAVDEVTCVGHPIGIVVADTEQHARMASLLVSVEYEELPAIISIEDAIEAGSFIDVSMRGVCQFQVLAGLELMTFAGGTCQPSSASRLAAVAACLVSVSCHACGVSSKLVSVAWGGILLHLTCVMQSSVAAQ